MSRYRSLIQSAASMPLAFYPLTSDLNDIMGGAPAIFERASRALFDDSATPNMRWYEEDEPIINSNGIFLERDDINEMLHSDNLTASGWSTNGSSGLTRTQVPIDSDITGAPGTATRLYHESSGVDRITRYFSGAGNNKKHSIGWTYKEIQDSPEAGVEAWLSNLLIGGARYKGWVINPITGTGRYFERQPGWIGVNFASYSRFLYKRANGWNSASCDFMFSNRGDGMNLGIRTANGGGYPRELMVGNVWMTADHGSQIISSSAPAARAAASLQIPLTSENFAYSIRFQTAFYATAQPTGNTKTCLISTDNDMALYAVSVSGALVLRLYFPDESTVDFSTSIPFSNVNTDGFIQLKKQDIWLNFGEITGGNRTLQLSIAVDDAGRVYSDVYTISAELLEFSAIICSPSSDTSNSEDNNFLPRSRYICNVTKSQLS